MAIETISRRNMYLCAALLLVLVSANLVQSQFAEKLIQNPCVSKTNCHECIQAKSCAWCMHPDFGDKPRCFQPSLSPLTGGCPEEYTYDPDNIEILNETRQLTRGGSAAAISGGSGQSIAGGYSSSSQSESYNRKDYSQESWDRQTQQSANYNSKKSGHHVEYGSFEEGKIVQIYPQRVSLKLRINQEHRLNIQYSQAQDYPVDLYYLMDLSKSMEDDKKSLSRLGKDLSAAMQNITSNFRLGFGSFVDKVLMPYVSTVPKNLEEPCAGCARPYGFRHAMSLSMDTRSFTEKVKDAAVSGNLDAPEGGFDAMMQAVVCRQHIGWREQARRLLVFSTDAGFHYAGDGKLGGVIAPNDGECHMNTNGDYTHSSILDYPSISQINLKVKENAINVIFAVTSTQTTVYEKLSKHIEGSSSATLSDDSSNVVDLVKEQYSKISSSVEMKDTASNAIKVTYYSSCLGGGAPVATSKCDGLRVGDVVSFQAEIVVTECPQDESQWKQTFNIYPVGINESLTVDLEMLCGCPCEKEKNEVYNRDKCKGHGQYKCGICECDSNHFGRNCECSIVDVHSESERDRGCRPDNTTLTDCSGKGQCVCGVCECDKRNNPEEIISGKYCECDNFSCERDQGLLCGGPDHGTCECGHCECKPGWKGADCTCRNSTDTCMPPNGGEICSGHGECVCGACKCQETSEGRYSGKFCEKCPTCSGRCHEFKECVQCQMYKTGPMGDNPELCAKNCTLFVPKGVEVLNVNEEEGDHLCIFYDENDCRFEFVYNDSDLENIKVAAKEKLECPTEIFILGIVMGVIASIVLIGLAFLFLWKILTTIHDRREFAKFEKERRSAKWDTGENPIYKQATSTFKNPTYNGGR
ncbi:integrin beta-PS isoform X2 [Sitodiplosis mosellana]|uniref:integrin beta-PS isoform X2 n=1 Tax=Sitodiplosis mosellana TaxID=263140 RepID=UPI002443E4CA|nr:integrin beta-PS isoform X2 [Sitodiplosis mosellana]XP_055305271.1 integrin beta-PS isoform X2 [Sitodiplosis mosellana]XP_055305272.1 integrin beta-PS isoform X2 [Sitodiplosis mosellana]